MTKDELYEKATACISELENISEELSNLRAEAIDDETKANLVPLVEAVDYINAAVSTLLNIDEE